MTQPHQPDNLAERLLAHLSGPLDRSIAAELAGAIVRTGHAEAALALIDELKDTSVKVTQTALEALPELSRRGALDEVAPWLDLGIALAGSSGATAMKYFKESPLIMGLIEAPGSRSPVLSLALELADSDANVAFDFFRQAPELLTVLPVSDLPGWAEIGMELARFDFVLGIEFLRQTSALARVLPLEQVRDWTGFGIKLITRNSLGKTDYMGTMEFFRTSPAILGDIDGLTIRALVVRLGSALADRDAERAILFLAESPRLLRRLLNEEWRVRVMQYGLLIAEQDAEAALAYLRRCPDLLALVGVSGTTLEQFEAWYRGGMEVLAYSAEGARAYFALETKKALESVTQAMSGVPLRQIARSLKLFAQGLCGADVTIQALPEPTDEPAQGKKPAQAASRARVSQDGRTILLPAVLRRHESREDNLRLYTVMTAHEAGHLEFGTYSLQLERLADLSAAVSRRYGLMGEQRGPGEESLLLSRPGSGGWNSRSGRAGEITGEPASASLGEVFAQYPQPAVIRDLWTLLEDARVEYRLQREYPGLQRDLAALAREAVTTRSLLHGMSVREMIVDALLLLSTTERDAFRIPDSIAAIVEQAWDLGRGILTPTASAEDAVRLADRIYVLLEAQLEGGRKEEAGSEGSPETDLGVGPQASEETAGEYRPVTNWAYRGEMNPELIRGAGPEGAAGHGQDEEQGAAPQLPGGMRRQDAGAAGRRGGDKGRRESTEGEDQGKGSLGKGESPGNAIDEWLGVDQARLPWQAHEGQDGRFLYDEWDGLIQDYRTGWCQVIERVAPEGSGDFAEAVLREHGAAVRMLRRYFETLRPPGLRLVRGQADGEEMDLDAVIRLKAEMAAGAQPSDRVYVRREKRERDVAALFLVDLSGSTGRQIESMQGLSRQGLSRQGPARQVIDVEKEGLVLLGQALDAIGDQYAVHGYSGQGRRHVDFVTLKDFDEPASARTAQRLGGVTPLQQNRDGAAIRHATRKLLARRAKTKLLILISDGKPLDEGYADEYSLEDTKMALREARMRGVEPFCITVDRGADDYLKRMYGEVRYLIIDHVLALPERLPRVYHRLTKS